MNRKTMVQGPEWKCILFFALPIMVGQLLQQLYSTVDGIIVGNFVSSDALGAVGNCGTLVFVYLAIAIVISKGRVQHTITVSIRDERNAMERFMLHFAHFEKQAEQLDRKHYLVTIRYAHDDEPEMVIRILSFGPMIEVLGPESFKKLIIEKLEKQLSCGLK